MRRIKESNNWYCAEGPIEPPPPPATIEIEVDGEKKSFNAEAVSNLLAQQSSATQKTQEVKAIVDAAAKYGLSPEEYVQQTEGAFGVFSSLVDQKIIDEQGNIIKAKKVEPPPGSPPLSPPLLKGDEKVDSIVAKALKGVVEPLTERLTAVEEDNTKLIRSNLQMQVQAKFPDLSIDDVSDLLAVASQDRKKSLTEHAQEMVEGKKGKAAEQRATYAKEFGINLEEFDANKLREQDPSGGAAALYKGKKFSFDTRGRHRKSDDVVNPSKASHGFVQESRKG